MKQQAELGTVPTWLYFLICFLVLGACSSSSNPSAGTSTAAPDISGSQVADPLDDGNGYRSLVASPSSISLHWKRSDGVPYGQLETLRKQLEKNGESLQLLTNSGIYLPGQIPAGLHVQNGVELTPINLKDGPGNFQLLPNGVFFIADGEAGVLESNRYQAAGLSPELAVQSGPQLLADGQIHPEFSETSDSRFIRNGVGVTPDGDVLFLISRRPVTFWEFASEFLDRGVTNALYLDGSISVMDQPVEGKRVLPNIPLAGILVVSSE